MSSLRPLEELAEINPPLKEVPGDDVKVLFVPMAAVDAATGTTPGAEERAFGDVKRTRTLFSDGDVLVAKITPCFENGKIAHASLKHAVGVGSTEFHVVRARSGRADARYLLHFLRLKEVRLQGERRMTGSAGQRRVPEQFLKGLLTPAPPLEEQRRIADVLDQSEELRAKRRNTIEKLNSLKQSIFLDMFGDPFAPATRTVPLAELAETVMGQSPPGSSYNEAGAGVPLLNGPAEFGETYPTERQWTTQPTRLCDPADILFCVRGATAGRLNLADKTYCLGRGLAAIRPREKGGATREFLFAVLSRYYDYFQRRGVGSTFINIGRQDLEQVPIPEPDADRARTFSQRLRQLDQVHERHEWSAASLTSLAASVQERAFAGVL